MTAIACELCNARLAIFRTEVDGPGYVIVDREPNALGRWRLIGNLAFKMLPEWLEPDATRGTISEKAGRNIALAFAAHQDTCTSVDRTPMPMTETRPTGVWNRDRQR